MAAFKAFVTVAVLVVVGYLLVQRDEIFLLHHYEGRVIRAYQESIGNAAGHYDQSYRVEVETSDGVETFVVPMKYYRELQPGVSVRKTMFSSNLSITR